MSEDDRHKLRSVIQTPLRSEIVGSRVLITGDHPWSENFGKITGVERTLVGFGLKVSMDNGRECFVFNPKHLRPA